MAQQDLNLHAEALTKMCRICAQLVFTPKNFSKIFKHKEAILKVYNLNTDSDEEHIHPSCICNKCRMSIGRAYAAMLAGKKFQGTLRSLGNFTSHHPLCTVCLTYTAHLNFIRPSTQPIPSTSQPPMSEFRSPTLPSTSADPSIESTTRSLDFIQSIPDPGVAERGQKRVWSAKASLKDVGRDYARKRTREVTYFIGEYCVKQKEDKGDLLYFLLTEHHRDSNDHRLNEVMSSWNDDLTKEVTADDCLAMRIATMTSKTKYKEQYKLMKSRGSDCLKPPHVLDELERSYMPGSVRFQLEGGADLIHHTPVKAGIAHIEYGSMSFEPGIVGSGGIHEELELPPPNFKGVEWSYSHAIAKTLEELDTDIHDGLAKCELDPQGDHLIYTTIKDGADGMGDVSITKESSDRMLPDKAFRAAFSVIKCEVHVGDTKVVVYEAENPNSVVVTRPILEAIADENNPSSGIAMLDSMEHNREIMKNKKMRVHVNGWWRSHQLLFYNSMIDEKLDRAQGGLQGSGSKFLCTLCHATRVTARSQVGTFSITRSFEETREMAEYVQANPDNRTQGDLSEFAQGVKEYPVLRTDPDHKLVDATHADINLGSFFKKLIICEVSRIFTWDVTRDVKVMYEDAEKRFNDHMRATLGLVPSMMMPGNYARQLFDPKNAETILELIPDVQRRNHLGDVISLFRQVRKVYRAHHPLPEDIAMYKANAVQMAELLGLHFAYASWPNYFHKVVEHVQEVLQDPHGPGTIGALSGAGNEAANKLFRDLRRTFSRKHTALDSLRDILWFHWLYTSPKLRRISKVTSRTYRCSNCNELGHNTLTCTSK